MMSGANPLLPPPVPPQIVVPVANPAPKPVPPPPADFDRYGKIWLPSDDASHPLKLNLPFPGVGEMKIPSQDELNMRKRLEDLATASDTDIRSKLEQWLPYEKMKIGDQGQLLLRIQQFKDQRTHIATDKIHDLGLTLNPEQQARFEKEYWDKRLKMETELIKQFAPIEQQHKQKMLEELYREFSSSGSVVPSPNKAKPPGPAPLAQSKPAPAPTNAVPAAPKPATPPVSGAPMAQQPMMH